MNIDKHRSYIGKFVITSSLLIFILVLILFALKGFTPEELSEILKYLVPIKAVYLTALVKYVIANKKVEEKKEEQNNVDSTELAANEKHLISPLYKTMANLFIYGHITFLTSSIVMAAFNIISFSSLTYFIAIIETFFGVYVGLIISDMFKVAENE
ncbi:hypothetical protein J8281_16590 [Aquimarina sp. U1-2]|uniref:hypothetical protein n=1 Tax=Aquimarina sp. U1-2 TaxID=2823141 RepID=UPI001AEC9155|nr:hypothetical protein [Aquimarina sp. U1-2]MBP2833815.1 hypothetical protein [Aquimarina sp. U1-2]